MAAAKAKQWFFKHEQMDFELQIMLGSCYFGTADAGEILMTAECIRSGDAESWVDGWLETAARVRGYADESVGSGNDVSARQAYLRASAYYAATLSMIDGTDDPGRGADYWKEHIECFDRFCSRLSPPAERVEIPYEKTPMPGYFFKPDDSGGPWATIIFNNGSDGPTVAMWGSGVAGALARGYAALVFDGPGQNAMLFMHKLPFRPDWEAVITPVVDFLVARPDVDPNRIALSGISQGGYWILRALAFEHRIAAGIADPGVMDVSTAVAGRFPKRMMKLLEAGEEEEFNKEMGLALKMMGQETRQTVAWRMKPYGADSYFEWIKASQEYNAREVIKQITCPMFIADPDDEQFWPGQSREVYDALESPKALVPFTREEGANWHCEPKARALYDKRMFDWLASVMPA
ncbi:MAG: prolyl oligopeptidase family serine peptidase [Actinobacteria bacterium]|nr:prolyl oligopeptidase family serine peptidase [Actinomycetota bacterium]MBU1942031.1 prolyl oligopeptidase family serine peptidase [Actinomycetota bacterium]MBU2687198.1 prolyl oligopeptidase family serine peptidase [Actinomycetota bacterium]